MSSSVHYKFSIAKDYDTVFFEGAFISVGDLKRAIVQQQKLVKATDFDLLITHAQTKDEYKDDSGLIPKNTSVIVKRVPATRNNFAAPVFYQKPEISPSLPHKDEGNPKGEEEKLKDVLDNSFWSKKPMMAPVINANQKQNSRYGETKIPPPSYICHRCNQPGHYINNCPTNGDPSYDFHKVKKPTGIPKSFLTPVDNIGGSSSGMLMMPGGGFAVMQTNSAPLERLASLASKERRMDEIPANLECPICKEILRDAVISSCCARNFCDQCIRRSLIESMNMTCPICKQSSSTTDLNPNLKARSQVDSYKKANQKVSPSSPPQQSNVNNVNAVNPNYSNFPNNSNFINQINPIAPINNLAIPLQFNDTFNNNLNMNPLNTMINTNQQNFNNFSNQPNNFNQNNNNNNNNINYNNNNNYANQNYNQNDNNYSQSNSYNYQNNNYNQSNNSNYNQNSNYNYNNNQNYNNYNDQGDNSYQKGDGGRNQNQSDDQYSDRSHDDYDQRDNDKRDNRRRPTDDNKSRDNYSKSDDGHRDSKRGSSSSSSSSRSSQSRSNRDGASDKYDDKRRKSDRSSDRDRNRDRDSDRTRDSGRDRDRDGDRDSGRRSDRDRDRNRDRDRDSDKKNVDNSKENSLKNIKDESTNDYNKRIRNENSDTSSKKRKVFIE